MRKIAIALAAATALLAGPALQAKAKLTPEQRLDKMLEGREAGTPRSCISNWDTRDMQILDGVAIVYRSGSTIYVNRPENARDLDSDDVLVTHLTGSQFCRLDIVRTFDRASQFPNGFISLGDFVPYKKVG
jgi:hypothetical protein